jgi:hypothetical protein
MTAEGPLVAGRDIKAACVALAPYVTVSEGKPRETTVQAPEWKRL